ncbi:glycerophosphodiester phosphodiesterase family protein [Kangiella sp. TOML190]|uniref:glycerophosphodiester phosphodiesterase n=1 Tax=Kangiella sp. TOML190 TaxID=2931351 RepID=UPI00203FAFBD|nr:glycerophosphodiester phosphodiesterase family protein [Kangiella sp. TOML190]
MLVIAHRGASGHYPENTLLAIAKALEAGCDGIEFDVQNVGEQLMVFHDETLERTTNGKGRLSDYSFNQLRQLDAGLGQRIPTLREVLDLIGDQAFINIELKGQDTANLVVKLLKLLAYEQELHQSSPCGYSHYPWRQQSQFIVSSYHFSELYLARQLEPELQLAVIADKRMPIALEFAKDIGAYSFHPSLAEVNKQLVRQVQAAGMRLFVHTVNTLDEIKRMQQLGVDGVFTDYPSRDLIKAL